MDANSPEKMRQERERITKEREKVEKKRLQDEKRLRADFTRVCKTESGRNIFRYMMNLCTFQESSLVANTTTLEILPMSTVYNEARRGVYIDIRKLIPKTQLVKIEMNPREGDDEDVDI